MRQFVYQNFGEQTGIGSTAQFFSLDGKNFVVDYGLSPEGEPGGVQRPALPDETILDKTRVDYAFFTHSHLDHLGAAPRFKSKHPEATIFVSSRAMKSADIALPDSLRINLRAIRGTDEEIEEGYRPPGLIFSKGEMRSFLSGHQVYQVDLDTNPGGLWLQPSQDQDWSFGFHPAGHTPGAMMLFIQSPSGTRVFLTGDVSSHDQRILPGVMLPSPEFLGDFFSSENDVIMVTEATNGYRDRIRPAEEEEALLVKACKEVAARGGVTLIPTFVQNRAAKAVRMLTDAGFQVHVEGSAQNFVSLELPDINTLRKEQKVIFIPRYSRNYEAKQASMERRSALALGHSGPAIVIAGSASMGFGWASYYASLVLPGRKNALMFLGYIFEGSTAEMALKARRGETIHINDSRGNPKPVNVRCDTFSFDFTSHDYCSALAERVRLANPGHLIIHHCQDQGYEGLVQRLDSINVRPQIYRGSHLNEIIIPTKGDV